VQTPMKWANRLRFKQLFWLFAALLLFDFIVPDPIPFLDEAILGVLTLIFGSMKKKVEDNSSSN
jgi:hypothetical protein